LERDDFCRAVHIYLTPEEFDQCFKTVGFQVSFDDITAIFNDHKAVQTGYLPMDEFYMKLSCWEDYDSKKEQDLRDLRDEAN
jgi:Ca2+-binding EF-hand superfamily protein